eukprot:364991-Chlamydomonas_euryale.AAC.15
MGHSDLRCLVVGDVSQHNAPRVTHPSYRAVLTPCGTCTARSVRALAAAAAHPPSTPALRLVMADRSTCPAMVLRRC